MKRGGLVGWSTKKSLVTYEGGGLVCLVGRLGGL